MKLHSKLSKTSAAAALAVLGVAIVAWSPTLPDKVVKIGAGGSTTNFQGFVAGDNNTINTATTSGYACVIGNGHNGSALASIVAGGVQSCDTAGSLVTGYNNTVGGIPAGNKAYYSAAIGELNQVMSTYGWAVGYQNEVSGTRGVAIGSGTSASNVNSTALGRYNATMAGNDVLVVGSGSGSRTKFTALRVTDNGSVILGRAQGDIAMGNYSN